MVPSELRAVVEGILRRKWQLNKGVSPLVSVIITTKNRAHFLRAAIESVLGQTFPNREIIVVNDGSTDGTVELLRGYEAAGRLVALNLPESKGANHARNAGAAMARGQFLAYLDDDDSWRPRKLDRQVALISSRPDVSLVGCWYMRDGVLHAPPASVSLWRLQSSNLIGAFSMGMFRKVDLLEVGGHDETLTNTQDWDLWMRLAHRGNVAVVQECLADYATSDPNAISRQDPAIHFATYMKVIRRYRSSMGFWAFHRHRYFAAYHGNPRAHPLLRLYLRAGCWFARQMDRLTLTFWETF